MPDTASASAYHSGDGGQWIANPFDEIAFEEAVRIRDRGAASDAVAVTVGSASAEEQLRAAMAMGLDRAIRVDDSRSLDSYAVARILAGVVRKEQPNVVILGKQAVDDDSNQAGQMLAGLLAWPQATFVSKVEFLEGGKQARCTRETDRGLEVIVVNLPAVITVDLRLNEPRYVSLPKLMKARRAPVETLTVDQFGVTTKSRTTLLSTNAPPRRAGGLKVQSVEELVGKLREHDKVI